MSKPPTPVDGTIKLQDERTIVVAGPDSESCLAVRRADWLRLKRLITGRPPQFDRLRIVYSILFGVAVTAGSSLVPLHITSGTPSWVLPLYVAFAAISLVAAVALCVTDCALRKRQVSHDELIATDMKEIESGFPRAQEFS